METLCSAQVESPDKTVVSCGKPAVRYIQMHNPGFRFAGLEYPDYVALCREHATEPNPYAAELTEEEYLVAKIHES